MIQETELVWVQTDTESWVPAKIIDQQDNGQEFVTKTLTKNEKITISKDEYKPVHESALKKLPDLLDLGDLNEPSLLHTVRQRYLAKNIYTSIGNSVLISVNPYQDINNLYSTETILKFKQPPKDQQHTPHIFATAQKAYISLLNTSKPQSILITGESGAGKTEATKKILNFLAHTSHHPHSTFTNNTSVENQLLQSNPILEAFGNAKTVRNDNSSRFGKFISINFDKHTTKLQTASVTSYLLERCRVVSLLPGERNFHIFYQLVAGLPLVNPNLAQKLGLIDCNGTPYSANYWKLLANDDETEEESREDSTLFRDTTHPALQNLFTQTSPKGESLLESVYSALVGILYLGEVSFESGEPQKMENNKNMKSSGVKALVSPGCEDFLKQAAHCLGVDAEDLRRAMTEQRIQDNNSTSGGGSIVKELEPKDACDVRDAICKAVYGKIFDYIVHKINQSIIILSVNCPASSSSFRTPIPPSSKRRRSDQLNSQYTRRSQQQQPGVGTKCLGLMIGLLDIYGFEMLYENSFEQLCINFANERLQRQFNENLFSLELNAYKEENIKHTHLIFVDNQPIIHRIDQLFLRIDEQSALGFGNEERIIDDLDPYPAAGLRCSLFSSPVSIVKKCMKHNRSSTSSYCESVDVAANEKQRVSSVPVITRGAIPHSKSSFTVRHYAGEVCYMTRDFLLKNRDNLPLMGVETLQKSSQNLLSNLFSSSFTEDDMMDDDARNRRMSISGVFRSQLDDLMSMLNETEASYVRCIKPNETKSAFTFDSEDSLRQLRCAGILEAVRIRREGYAYRISFREFYLRYNKLAPRSHILQHAQVESNSADYECLARGLVDALGKSDTVRKDFEAVYTALSSSSSSAVGPIQLGRTLVFIKERMHELLEEAWMTSATVSARKIQQAYRRHRFISKVSFYASINRISHFFKHILLVTRAQNAVRSLRESAASSTESMQFYSAYNNDAAAADYSAFQEASSSTPTSSLFQNNGSPPRSRRDPVDDLEKLRLEYETRILAIRREAEHRIAQEKALRIQAEEQLTQAEIEISNLKGQISSSSAGSKGVLRKKASLISETDEDEEVVSVNELVRSRVVAREVSSPVSPSTRTALQQLTFESRTLRTELDSAQDRVQELVSVNEVLKSLLSQAEKRTELNQETMEHEMMVLKQSEIHLSAAVAELERRNIMLEESNAALQAKFSSLVSETEVKSANFKKIIDEMATSKGALGSEHQKLTDTHSKLVSFSKVLRNAVIELNNILSNVFNDAVSELKDEFGNLTSAAKGGLPVIQQRSALQEAEDVEKVVNIASLVGEVMRTGFEQVHDKLEALYNENHHLLGRISDYEHEIENLAAHQSKLESNLSQSYEALREFTVKAFTTRGKLYHLLKVYLCSVPGGAKNVKSEYMVPQEGPDSYEGCIQKYITVFGNARAVRDLGDMTREMPKYASLNSTGSTSSLLLGSSRSHTNLHSGGSFRTLPGLIPQQQQQQYGYHHQHHHAAVSTPSRHSLHGMIPLSTPRGVSNYNYGMDSARRAAGQYLNNNNNYNSGQQ